MPPEQENHFTVFIRLPFDRGDFVDPPQVAWSATKERELWDTISRQSKGNEVDWKKLSEKFGVTQSFLLQQAAWLYERQLSQVRAQMRRVGNRQSAMASPVPPASATGSVVGSQAAKRSNLPSRAPSRLSTQTPSTVNAPEATSPATPIRSRTQLPFRSGSGAGISHSRGASTSRPLSRRSSRDNESSSRTHSRRGSVQHQISKSPTNLQPPEQSSSEEDLTASKTTYRRSNPAILHRRAPSIRKSQHTRGQSISHQQVDEETEEEDTPAFLPFTDPAEKLQESPTATHDPSATIRGGLRQSGSSQRPALNRNVTSERIRPGKSTAAPQNQPPTQMTSSTSSISSSNNQPLQPQPLQPTTTVTANRSPSSLPTPLSPRQQAALAAAAGLSPRRRSAGNHHHNGGSESSPSMGSSFSDLDDASVTQSALEEALMSGMGSTTTTAGVTGAGGLSSRVSGISQALRSRYFDARGGGVGGVGGGVGEGQR